MVLVVLAACSQAEPVEIIKEVVVEKEVIKEVPVEKIVKEEVIREVQVEKIVKEEVIKEVPVEKIVKEEVVKVVERTQTIIATPGPVDQQFFMTTLDPGHKRGGKFITGNNGPPGHFDFYVSGSITWQGWITPMYDNLLRRDTRTPDVTIVPDLAQSWDISDDLTTYTYHLREGVKFHNGHEMTSEDAKASLERVVFPERFETSGLGSAYRVLFQSAKLKEINTPDAYTVELVMEEPRSVGWALSGTAEQGVKISQKEVLEEFAGNLRDADPTEVSGTGPFKTIERTDDHVVQEANVDYWNPNAPYVDRIEHIWVPIMTPQVTAALASGRIDWSMFIPPGDVPTILEDPQFNLLTHVRPSYHLMPLNITRKPFDDVRVRKAVTLVFDQEAVINASSEINAIMFGGGWFAEGQGVYSLSADQLRNEKYWRSPTPEDIAEAQQLLADAGYPNGEGVPKLDLLGRSDGPWWQLMLELEQAWLKQHLNIDSEIRLSEVSVVGDDTRNLRFDMMSQHYAGMEVQTPEFYVKNALGQCPDGPCASNLLNYNDPDLDAKLRELELEFDPARRMELSKALSDYMTETMPEVPWGTGEITYHVFNDHLKGFMPAGSQFVGVYMTNKWDHIWIER